MMEETGAEIITTMDRGVEVAHRADHGAVTTVVHRGEEVVRQVVVEVHGAEVHGAVVVHRAEARGVVEAEAMEVGDKKN